MCVTHTEEAHKHHVVGRKSAKIEHKLYDCIHMKFKSRHLICAVRTYNSGYPQRVVIEREHEGVPRVLEFSVLNG